MANVYSPVINNIMAIPQVVNPRGESQSEVLATKATLEVTTGNLALNNVIMVCPLDYRSKIHSIMLMNDDLDSGTAAVIHVGLFKYDPKTQTFAEIDNDCYAASSTVFQAAAKTDVAFATRDIAKVGNTVFQDGGLTADPNDGSIPILAITIATAPGTAVAGTISVVVQHT